MLKQLQQIAKEAGIKTLKFYKTGTEVTSKSDDSPLTKADMAAHYHIVNELAKLTPEIPVLSEESVDKNINSNIYWLVDPLDGTKEFIKGTGEFTVNIALMKNGNPVMAVIYAPALEITYAAEIGGKAYKSDSSGTSEIQTRKLDSQIVSIVASKDHAGPKVDVLKTHLKTDNLQSMGSSFKFMLIAEGKADLYLRDKPTMEWDIAAAHCILKVAGGEIYQTDGQVMPYQKTELRNPGFLAVGDKNIDHRELLEKTGYTVA